MEIRNNKLSRDNYLTEILTTLNLKHEQTNELFQDYGLDKQKFCVMPFVTIILEPDGNIGICRHKGSDFTFGNIRNHTLDEIWESDKVRAWRNDFASGEIHVCKTELIDRKCNQCPELNKLLPYAEVHNTKNPKILRLTANLNGKCNLQCQMCDIWKLPNGFYNEENFWKPARKKFFRDILEVDLLSGEPFIQHDTYKLINEISAVNPDCSWTFTTNVHWALTDKIKDDLNRIKIKNIILSIDSLDEKTYFKIRTPGNLNFVLRNVENLLAYQEERLKNNLSSLNLRLNCLIQKDNWKEAKAMINYCLDSNIIPFLTFLYEPSEFSLLNLSSNDKKEILDYYFSTLDKYEILFIQRIIKPLIRSLDKIDYIYYLQKLNENRF
jgi:radical SAM protein with 4Fe4S-binding SPASM domain